MSFKQKNGVAPHELGEVADAVNRFKEETARALGDNLCCLYLTGSLTSGDFDPNSSDIDFTTITHTQITTEKTLELADTYRWLRDSGSWWDSRTEGIYLPIADCQRPSANQARHYVLKTNGNFELSQERSDWLIQLYLARTKGVLLAGHVKIDTICPDITPSQLKVATATNAAPFLKKPEESLQPERVTALHVLTACRLAYTTETGLVASKVEAAEWAMQKYPEFNALINKALITRGSFTLSEYGATYDFIDFLENEKQETRA